MQTIAAVKLGQVVRRNDRLHRVKSCEVLVEQRVVMFFDGIAD